MKRLVTILINRQHTQPVAADNRLDLPSLNTRLLFPRLNVAPEFATCAVQKIRGAMNDPATDIFSHAALQLVRKVAPLLRAKEPIRNQNGLRAEQLRRSSYGGVWAVEVLNY